jgi:hypothetical protein
MIGKNESLNSKGNNAADLVKLGWQISAMVHQYLDD